jgi:hypothetical protein
MTTSCSHHLALVSAVEPLPWYAQPVEDLEALELRLLAQATGGHLPSELAETVAALRARRGQHREVWHGDHGA